MAFKENQSRRLLVKRLVLAGALVPLAVTRLTSSRAADAPLLSPEDPAAKKVKYTENSAAAGNKCANCALYQGSYSSTQGPCQLFPGKLVMAAGWCSSWSPQM